MQAMVVARAPTSILAKGPLRLRTLSTKYLVWSGVGSSSFMCILSAGTAGAAAGWPPRPPRPPRSGERRGGEEGRYRGEPDHLKKKKKKKANKTGEVAQACKSRRCSNLRLTA